MQGKVTTIGLLRGKKVALFPHDTYPKYGYVLDMANDRSGILLEITRETDPHSGYREGDVAYFAGSFVLKVVR